MQNQNNNYITQAVKPNRPMANEAPKDIITKIINLLLIGIPYLIRKIKERKRRKRKQKKQ